MSKKASCHPDRPHYGEGQCKQCWQADYQQRTSVARNQRLRDRYRDEPEYKKKRKEKAWESQVKRLYSISPAQYWAMYEAQDGRCKLCKQEHPPGRHLAVDHDHRTQEVRGLLCSACNRVLSYLERDEWTGDAFRYLHRDGHPEVDKLLLDKMGLHARKNHDYAKGGNPLGNFNRVAAIFSLYPGLRLSDPIVVMLTYAMKQIDAILWGFSAGIEHKVEGPIDRLSDVLVYSGIAICGLKDRAREAGKGAASPGL